MIVWSEGWSVPAGFPEVAGVVGARRLIGVPVGGSPCGVSPRFGENGGVNWPLLGNQNVQTCASSSRCRGGCVRTPAPRPACQPEEHLIYKLCLAVTGGGSYKTCVIG